MTVVSPPKVGIGGKNGVLLRGSLLPRAGDAGCAAMHDETTVRWALDVSDARPVIASIAEGTGPANWIEALLADIRIADVDQEVVHLVGPLAGRRRMIGQPVTAYWPPESWPILAELVVAAVADYPPRAARTREITSLLFADAVISISTADDGTIPDIVFLSVRGRLVDDRSLWAVHASEARFRKLIHHLPFALLQVDSTPMRAIFDRLRLEGITDIRSYLDDVPELVSHSRDIIRVTDANRAAVKLFSVDGADLLIGPVDYLFAASPETARRVITAHFNGQRHHAETMKLRTFDGRLRDVTLSVTYPTPPELLDVAIIALEDVTDRLQTEAQLRQLQADYSRAARVSMLGELATSIAHEVNQPLSAIVTNAETSQRWLSRDEPNLTKVGQLTARIAEGARHASDIVQRIRGMAARRAPERVSLDLNEVVHEAVLFLRHEIESRAIDLSVQLERDVPKTFGDRVQLQQVIVNLILNAVQAQSGGPGRRIDLSTTMHGDGAVIFAIHDGGPGIAAANLERVFDSFFTTKDEGMGIGLAICQSIIAAHGGMINASNHPDGGALFRFSLPGAAWARA